jgi:uncharacterized membrane protein
MESLFSNLAAIEKFMNKLRTLVIMLIVVFSMALCVSIAGSVVLVVNCVMTYQQSKQQMERLRERRDYVRDSLSVEREKRIEAVKREIEEFHAKKGWKGWEHDNK